MQIRRIFLLFVSIACAAVFASCSDNGIPAEEPATVTGNVSTPTMVEPENRLTENPVTILYQEEPNVRYTEPYGSRVFSGCPGYSCEYNKVSYTFPESIDEDRRNEVVVKTDEILTQLEKATGFTRQEGLEINILKEEYDARLFENKLYIGYSSFGGLEYALGAAQACLGTGVNYGLIYGLCCSLAAALDYEVGEPLAIEDAFNLNQRSLLDMNYACFMERYAGEDLAKIKAVSRAFYNSLTYEERSSLCRVYTDKEFYNCLNRFLVLNGQNEYHNSDIWNIRIMNGGEDVRLFWQDEWADYYLREDYQDPFIVMYKEHGFQGYGENPMNSDYDDLRQHIIAAHKQIVYVREKVGAHIEIPNGRVDVCFRKRSNVGQEALNGGQFYHGDRLEIFTNSYIGHEYVHYILSERDIGYYLEHMVCYYLGNTIPIDEHMDSFLTYYKWMYELIPTDPILGSLYRRLVDYLGHEIDWTNDYDIMCAFNNELIDTVNKSDVLTNLDLLDAGFAKGAFTAYLVQAHGENNVLSAILVDNPESLGYESWEAAVDVWESWKKDEFANY